MIRMGMGIATGALFAAGILYGIGRGVTRLHPLPPDFGAGSLQAYTDYMAAAPAGALWLLATAGGLAALVGGWIAARIARGHRGVAALWIAAPLTVAAIASAALVPQPDWVPILGMLLPIPLAVAAWRLAIPRAEL